MVSAWAALLTALVCIQSQSASGQHACASAPRSRVDFTVQYSLPHFQADKPIQNIAVQNWDSEPGEVFVACQNKLTAVSSAMLARWHVRTGPVGSPECDTCTVCDIEIDPDDPVDTDNEILLLDPAGFYLPYLYLCGSTQHGICYFVDITSENPTPRCLYKKEQNSATYCPDCLASPLGTKVTIVEQGATSLFFVAASVDEKVTAKYPRRSISVVRPLATEDGFSVVMNGLTVLPAVRNSTFRMDYIYSFSTKEYVYFLSLQREDPYRPKSPFQTRLGRLHISITEVWMYREVVLDCRYNPKRRRRHQEEFRDIVYNGLQAAHLGRAGKDLAAELRVAETEDVLFGVFAEVDERGVAQKKSALCAYPLSKVNKAIDDGVEECCTLGTEQLSRGLSHFQPLESCPHEVSNLCLFLRPARVFDFAVNTGAVQRSPSAAQTGSDPSRQTLRQMKSQPDAFVLTGSRWKTTFSF